jgi:competence protein ComFC
MGEALSKPLINLACQLNWDLDMVVPVPLGAARQKERGYNQASLLARPLAMQLNLNYRSKALLRVRETQSQIELNREQRKLNVAGAFRADPKNVAGKNVLVIDDVTTTGSTLDSCADALLYAGAGKVYGLTLARAENLSAQ